MEINCGYILVVEGDDIELMLKAYSKADEFLGTLSSSIKHDRFNQRRFFVFAPGVIRGLEKELFQEVAAHQKFLDWIKSCNARTGGYAIRIHKVNFGY